jgi:hypothetical protein
MKFAKLVFRVAAVWGVLMITPLYFLFDAISRNDPPRIRIQDFSTDLWERPSHGRSHSSSLPAIPYAFAHS